MIKLCSSLRFHNALHHSYFSNLQFFRRVSQSNSSSIKQSEQLQTSNKENNSISHRVSEKPCYELLPAHAEIATPFLYAKIAAWRWIYPHLSASILLEGSKLAFSSIWRMLVKAEFKGLRNLVHPEVLSALKVKSSAFVVNFDGGKNILEHKLSKCTVTQMSNKTALNLSCESRIKVEYEMTWSIKRSFETYHDESLKYEVQRGVDRSSCVWVSEYIQEESGKYALHPWTLHGITLSRESWGYKT